MKLRFSAAILAAALVWVPASAQTSGSVTNHAFALGKGPGVTGYTSLLCTSAQLAVGQSAADPICQTITGDVTISAGGVTAIGAGVVHSSMLNADVFSTAHSWSATQSFPNNSLTLAEFPTIGANTVIGSVAGGTPAALTQAQITAMINLATASLPGALPAWPNNTTTYFRGNGTYATLNFAALGGQATFAQFPTGSLDQVIGYFGATTANAIAINNCAAALTYSTTTHTFGCNSTAGTGTVTEYKLTTGNGIASTGTCDVTTNNTSTPCNVTVDQTAWTTFTPSPSCGTATFTVNSAKAKVWGKITHWEFDFTITAIGTCTTSMTITLPNTANSAGGGAGREIAVAGFGMNCAVGTGSNSMGCTPVQQGISASTVFGVNDRLIASGVYENQ